MGIKEKLCFVLIKYSSALDIFIPVLKLKGDSFCPYIFCIMINSGVRHDENLHNYGQNLQGQKKT